jgi:ribosome-associated translation inhibitor RaiA
VQIDIQSRGFEISQAARRSIQEKIHHAFRYQNRRVRKVVVRFFSSIGSRGQTLKSCHVLTDVNGLPQLITERNAENLMEATITSIQIANRSINKQLKKMKKFKHASVVPIGRSFA